jgi:hypothetical protein
MKPHGLCVSSVCDLAGSPNTETLSNEFPFPGKELGFEADVGGGVFGR